MRLLNTKTLVLEDFFEDATPAYAILSHTWETEEVTYQDMQGIMKGTTNPQEVRLGYSKIQHCCKQADKDGYDYVWIDTCCIDKSSSAELSEAINSMYVWYQNAAICYAYLSDAKIFLRVTSVFGTQLFNDEAGIDFEELLRDCRWFTRGWTLQELIAPSRVDFYDQNWELIGEKGQLSCVLSRITGIDNETLAGGNVKEVSVAKRMSWASKRVTTRAEDIAYCLLGIFGVNLPLLYGEGKKAFTRLQEEIMKNSDDQSLFAWEESPQMDSIPHDQEVAITITTDDDQEPEVILPRYHATESSESRRRGLSGFLAPSPGNFENAGSIVPYRNWEISTPYSMTNQGLRVQLEIIRYGETDDYIGILQCHYEDNYLGPLGVYIRSIVSARGDQFARDTFRLKPVIVVPEHVALAKLRTIYIRQEILLPSARDYDRTNQFLIRTMPREDYELTKVEPHGAWHETQRILRCSEGGYLYFTCNPRGYTTVPLPFVVVLRAFDDDTTNIGLPEYSCQIFIPRDDEEWEEKLSKAPSPIDYNSGTAVSHSSQMDLNPWDHSNRLTALAKISKEKFMGQTMMVVDIDIRSVRLRRIPFFATDPSATSEELLDDRAWPAQSTKTDI
ncbi:hypothetical protein GLAREA_11758 [Glarea lozoyensis ATCC 20868]|uniref:Uncharacterized protein n=1 Tax=Glarea lozoyensis (strain ATCC 20868 / MF5171) TaxID=1116229 RepID=S3CFA0_GLAL2|nr:uncharacterized protein GLAREA_11758 [Glarea lozoyensis ATCC 20868]EPE25177.1 hypothetical protein GLAREA_11758 [Glarea lozoyensis ATCC 20868]